MDVITGIDTMTVAARVSKAAGGTLALVPTMGYLHAGHMAHLAEARRRTDVCIASIFVNPTQFAPEEDLASYPRDRNRDLAALEAAGCDIVFMPSADDMYRRGFCTYVEVHGISERFEGAHRPSHFRGVTTVVTKLLNIVRPDVLTLGRKDAQQLAVLRRMVGDLNFGVSIVEIETIRESDGLAMSSRNIYLSDTDRVAATSIHRALLAARRVRQGHGSVDDCRAALLETLSPSIELDYAEVVDPDTFLRPFDETGPVLAIVAGRVGRARLIDNMEL